ncbi:MAG: hypothetical protein KKF58_02875 [Gammaproteobacteria bacterium]|nr:hypothetical protein [Gammaproteobacteria bacterium]MBU1447233.1 hypothetical protein [Gammaproteobacteria bacterium]MDD2929582.1 hypothetical protein [Sideroxydans sp.]
MKMFDLLKLLTRSEVDFVLVGGLAVALQGYQRVTLDVDVVLAMDEANLQRFIAAAKSAGLRPGIPVPLDTLARPELIDQWHREKGMLAFSLRTGEARALTLDVLVKPVVPFAQLRQDASMVKVGEIEVPVASIAHLIEMKSGTGRSKDLLDIEELRKIQSQQ